MKPEFEISAMQEAGKKPVTVFHIHGDIDTNTFQRLEEKAKGSFQEGMRDLLLDLSEVNFISSAGLRALHTIYMMLRSAAGDESDEMVSKGIMDGSYKSHHLKLLNPSQNVQLAMKTAGFDMYIESLFDREAAISSF